MATQRTLRIAPDLPNSDDRFDDTPPASPYQNRLRSKSKPNIRIGSFISIPLPTLRRLAVIGLVLLTFGLFFAPKRYKPRLVKPKHDPSLRYKNVDWRLYAYSTYATDKEHLCAALMVFDQLETLGSKAERILFYPQDWDSHPEHKPEHAATMIDWAKSLYGAKLMPVKVHGVKLAQKSQPWQGRARYDIPGDRLQMDPSTTKFMAVAQTQFLRVIHLDPQISLLKHLDELFLAPHAMMASTRRYLTNPTTRELSAHFFMVFPREEDAEHLLELASRSKWGSDEFDSQVLTEQYRDQAMILSHRRYGLNSLEFLREDHDEFLGNEWEDWNPERALREASIVVFDGDAVPKPWVNWPPDVSAEEVLPRCSFEKGSEVEIGCRNRAAWLKLYNDHQRRRRDVCGLLAIPGGPFHG